MRDGRAAKLAEVRAADPSLSITAAGRIVGYPRTEAAWRATKTRAYALRYAKLDAQRRGLSTIPGFSLIDSACHYEDIARFTKRDDPSVSIKARARVDSLLGHDAPAQVQVSTIGLMVELSAVSSDDLSAMLSELRPDLVGNIVGNEAA